MDRGRTEQTVRSGAGTLALMALALALGGCGSTDLLKSSPLDIFSSSSKATNDTAAAGGTANISADDVDCPEVQVRTGAATLMIGSKPGEGVSEGFRSHDYKQGEAPHPSVRVLG